MRIIVIEDIVYAVSESEYQLIILKKKEFNGSLSDDVDMDEFLQLRKPYYKRIGPVEFDFRL